MAEDNTDMIDEVSDIETSAKKKAEKICFICESEKAEFCIKGAPGDCYCKGCAEEAFGDVECLERI